MAKLRIRQAREKAGYSQKELAAKVGVAQNTFHGYESGKHLPKPEVLGKIAAACGVTADYLLGRDGTEPAEKVEHGHISDEALSVAKRYQGLDRRGKGSVLAAIEFEERFLTENQQTARVGIPIGGVTVTVYEQPAAAGLGNYLSEPDSHEEIFPEERVPEGTDLGILISGHSMEPQIPDGCVAFVRSAASVEPGSIGIFILNGQAYCKKLIVDRELGTVLLRSFNPEYEDIELREGDDLRTVGVVLGSMKV